MPYNIKLCNWFDCSEEPECTLRNEDSEISTLTTKNIYYTVLIYGHLWNENYIHLLSLQQCRILLNIKGLSRKVVTIMLNILSTALIRPNVFTLPSSKYQRIVMKGSDCHAKYCIRNILDKTECFHIYEVIQCLVPCSCWEKDPAFFMLARFA